MSHKKNKNKPYPPTLSKREISAQLQHLKVQISKGPIPPPDVLKQYEEIYPGAAKQIFDAFDRQLNHRIDLENKHMDAGITNSRLGIISAFTLSIVAIICGTVCIFYGKSAEGIAVIIGSLASLVAVFMYGRNKEKKERDQKFNEVLK